VLKEEINSRLAKEMAEAPYIAQPARLTRPAGKPPVYWLRPSYLEGLAKYAPQTETAGVIQAMMLRKATPEEILRYCVSTDLPLNPVKIARALYPYSGATAWQNFWIQSYYRGKAETKVVQSFLRPEYVVPPPSVAPSSLPPPPLPPLPDFLPRVPTPQERKASTNSHYRSMQDVMQTVAELYRQPKKKRSSPIIAPSIRPLIQSCGCCGERGRKRPGCGVTHPCRKQFCPDRLKRHPTCGCCGQPGRTRAGCGRSHPCRKKFCRKAK